MFFVADTLTGSIVCNAAGEWWIDEKQLEVRFVDLYFRHIDPVKGKTFRPEWGQHAVGDLTTTMAKLGRTRAIAGANPGETVTQTLNAAALRAIDKALKADDDRRTARDSVVLSIDFRKRVEEARAVFVIS